jgi:putative MATE family efflux protein
MAEQACITLLGIVNAAMAGRAGTDVASGVGLVNAVTNVVNSVFSAVALGGTVAVSRARGAGRREESDRAAFQSIFLSVASAVGLGAVLVFFSRPAVDAFFGASSAVVRANGSVYLAWTAAGYPFLAATLAASGVLRGAGDARTPMVVNVLMNAVNAAVGWVFIFGLSAGGAVLVPALGAAGAGIALTVARIAGTVFYAVAFARGAGRFSVRFAGIPKPFFRGGGLLHSELRADRAAASAVLFVGIPAAVESLAFTGGKLLTQTFVAGLGTSAAAADYIASSAAGLVQVPLTSLTMAVPPLVGGALGCGRPDEARSIVGQAVLLGSAATVAIVVPGFIFTPQLLGLSSGDPAVLNSAVSIFRLFCVCTPFLWAVSFLVPAGLRGAGDGRFTMVVAIASMWTVRVGLGWLLGIPFGLGIMGVWIAMLADWLARAAFFLPRLRGGAWLRDRPR